MTGSWKVVGTTFHPFSSPLRAETEWTEQNTPHMKTTVLLIPEPENPYDPTAVKVVVPLLDGTPHHLGYLAKEEPVKQKIKGPVTAVMDVSDYGASYNPSYVLTEIHI